VKLLFCFYRWLG